MGRASSMHWTKSATPGRFYVLVVLLFLAATVVSFATASPATSAGGKKSTALEMRQAGTKQASANSIGNEFVSLSPMGVAKIGGIGVGSRVKRGPTWRYFDQDGGDGKVGTVVELKSWKGSNYTLGVRVRWDANSQVNTYRWSLNTTSSANDPGATSGKPAPAAPFYRDLVVLGEVDLQSPLFAKAQEDADRAATRVADDAAAAAAGREKSTKITSATKSARRSLLQLYRQCNGPRWFVRKGFQEAEEALSVKGISFNNDTAWETLDPCTSLKGWEGVTCNNDGIVFAIDLSGNNIDCGPRGLPFDILLEGLPALKSINLERNKIAGPLSPLMCKLLGMQHLNLASNKLTGPLPECLAAMPKLETLSLHSNQLSGKIPKLFLKGASAKLMKLLHLHGNPDLEIENKQEARECNIPSLSLPAGQGVPRIKMRPLVLGGRRGGVDDDRWPDE